MVAPWIPWAVGAVVAGTAGVGAAIVTVDGDTVEPVVSEADATTEPVGDESLGIVTLPDEVIVVTMFDCPGEAPVGTLRSGDRIVATAVDPSGGWLAIRDPRRVENRVWVPRAVVVPDGSVDGLPAEPCEVPAGDAVALPTSTTATTTTVPESTTTTPESETTAPDGSPAVSTTSPPPASTTPPPATTNPTPPASTTPPPATTNPPATQPPAATTTTAAPDTTGPSISASRSPGTIFEDFPGLCTGEATTATISASADDPSGVASLTATWSFGGGATRNLLNGPTQFGPIAYGTVSSGATQNASITITAVDGVGNSNQTTLTIAVTSADACFG